LKSSCFVKGITVVLLIIVFCNIPALGESAEDLFKAGNSLALEKRYEEAIVYYDEALELEPENVKILLNKALALTFLSRYEESNACFDRAIELTPDFADAWHWKGVSLVLQGQLEDSFVEIVTAFNEVDPEEEGNEEKLSAARKYFEESLICFDRALEINPVYYEAWYWKGFALYNCGTYEECLACYDRALELNPDYTRAREAREELLKLLEKAPGDY